MWGRGQAGPEGCCVVSLPWWQQALPRVASEGGRRALPPEGTEGGTRDTRVQVRGWVPPSAHALGRGHSWVRSCEGTWPRLPHGVIG